MNAKVISIYAADTSGVCSALYELGGMTVVHDASGCNSTYATHDEPRWYDRKSMIYISALTESDVVMGNDGKFIRDVAKAAGELSPKFIAICGSPMPAMTGFDYSSAAEEIERLSRLGQHAEQPVCKVHARDLLLQRRFEKLRREHNACAVRQDEIGAVDERAERFVVQRLIGDLGVRGHGIAGLFARKGLISLQKLHGPAHRLIHRDIIKLQPHDIQFHVQAYLTNLEFIYHLSTYFRICPRNFGFNFPARCFTYGRFCINCYESEA